MLKLDVSKSKEVYDTCKDRIKPKECYNNVFNIMDYDPKPFHDGTWKISYGYVEVMSGLYCRHCFIVDNDKVIDPTTFTHKEPPTHRTYYVMYVFDDVGEYLSAVVDADGMPALDFYLKDKDKAAQEWAREHSLLFVG